MNRQEEAVKRCEPANPSICSGIVQRPTSPDRLSALLRGMAAHKTNQPRPSGDVTRCGSGFLTGWAPWGWLAACLFAASVCFAMSGLREPVRVPAATPKPSPKYETKAIEEIREGDTVLARDEFGREVGMKRVAKVYRRVSDHLRILTFHAPDGSEQTLKTTDEHPFWAENRHAWIEAKNLEVGDTFIGPRSELQTLADTAYEAHPEGIPVFNFQVEDYHSYFAANVPFASSPILVHNADYPTDFQVRGLTQQFAANFNSEREARNFARQKVGHRPVDVGDHKLRSRDGRWQYRAKTGDTDDNHVHLERLDPETGEVLQNWHLYFPPTSS